MQEAESNVYGQLKRPSWHPWLKTLDELPNGVKLGPVSVSAVGAFWRRLTLSFRVAHAAWEWLRPEAPCSLGDLPRLKKLNGLDHLPDEIAVREMIDACKEVRRKQPQTAALVDRRTALLEFLIDRPDEPAELVQQRISMRRALHDALVCEDAAEAFIRATRVINMALEGAGQAVCLALGQPGRKYGFAANLMVPAALPDASGPAFPDDARFRRGRKLAVDLWQHIQAPDTCLAVVAETKEAHHLGFWLPLAKGEGDAVLPGAGAAYYHMVGSAVFKDDLPRLAGFPERLSDAWRSYIRTHLHERLFVSLPFVVCKESGQPVTIAVVNVNADPPVEERWRRACFDEWLSLAARWVADFAEIAYTAHMYRVQLQDPGNPVFPELRTGASTWDRLTRGKEEGRP